MFYKPILIITASFLLELYAGKFKYKMHPLNIMGSIAFLLEKRFNSISISNSNSKPTTVFISGILFNLAVIFTITLLYSVILLTSFAFYPLLFYILSVYVMASFMSTGGLRYEALKIYGILKSKKINEARKELSSLVGRDTCKLNESEISRAAIESVSENTGDGIGSVIFYFALGSILGYILKTLLLSGQITLSATVFFGVLSAVIYKSVNLLDSLVGYRNDKYEKFGKFSARLDDVLNFIPFRITSFFMLLSVIILSITLNSNKSKKHYFPAEALKSWIKFRKSHPSPNGGQLESTAAGALRIKLGGINFYGGIIHERPVIGFNDYGYADKENIAYAVRIMETTSALLVIFYAALTFVCIFYLHVFFVR